MVSNIAQQSFSLANNISTISPQDEIYRFDVEANKRINRDAPWNKESVPFMTPARIQFPIPFHAAHITSNHAKYLPSRS